MQAVTGRRLDSSVGPSVTMNAGDRNLGNYEVPARGQRGKSAAAGGATKPVPASASTTPAAKRTHPAATAGVTAKDDHKPQVDPVEARRRAKERALTAAKWLEGEKHKSLEDAYKRMRRREVVKVKDARRREAKRREMVKRETETLTFLMSSGCEDVVRATVSVGTPGDVPALPLGITETEEGIAILRSEILKQQKELGLSTSGVELDDSDSALHDSRLGFAESFEIKPRQTISATEDDSSELEEMNFELPRDANADANAQQAEAKSAGLTDEYADDTFESAENPSAGDVQQAGENVSARDTQQASEVELSENAEVGSSPDKRAPSMKEKVMADLAGDDSDEDECDNTNAVQKREKDAKDARRRRGHLHIIRQKRHFAKLEAKKKIEEELKKVTIAKRLEDLRKESLSRAKTPPPARALMALHQERAQPLCSPRRGSELGRDESVSATTEKENSAPHERLNTIKSLDWQMMKAAVEEGYGLSPGKSIPAVTASHPTHHYYDPKGEVEIDRGERLKDLHARISVGLGIPSTEELSASVARSPRKLTDSSGHFSTLANWASSGSGSGIGSARTRRSKSGIDSGSGSGYRQVSRGRVGMEAGQAGQAIRSTSEGPGNRRRKLTSSRPNPNNPNNPNDMAYTRYGSPLRPILHADASTSSLARRPRAPSRSRSVGSSTAQIRSRSSSRSSKRITSKASKHADNAESSLLDHMENPNFESAVKVSTTKRYGRSKSPTHLSERRSRSSKSAMKGFINAPEAAGEPSSLPTQARQNFESAQKVLHEVERMSRYLRELTSDLEEKVRLQDSVTSLPGNEYAASTSGNTGGRYLPQEISSDFDARGNDKLIDATNAGVHTRSISQTSDVSTDARALAAHLLYPRDGGGLTAPRVGPGLSVQTRVGNMHEIEGIRRSLSEKLNQSIEHRMKIEGRRPDEPIERLPEMSVGLAIGTHAHGVGERKGHPAAISKDDTDVSEEELAAVNEPGFIKPSGASGHGADGVDMSVTRLLEDADFVNLEGDDIGDGDVDGFADTQDADENNHEESFENMEDRQATGDEGGAGGDDEDTEDTDDGSHAEVDVDMDDEPDPLDDDELTEKLMGIRNSPHMSPYISPRRIGDSGDSVSPVEAFVSGGMNAKHNNMIFIPGADKPIIDDNEDDMVFGDPLNRALLGLDKDKRMMLERHQTDDSLQEDPASPSLVRRERGSDQDKAAVDITDAHAKDESSTSDLPSLRNVGQLGSLFDSGFKLSRKPREVKQVLGDLEEPGGPAFDPLGEVSMEYSTDDSDIEDMSDAEEDDFIAESDHRIVSVMAKQILRKNLEEKSRAKRLAMKEKALADLHPDTAEAEVQMLRDRAKELEREYERLENVDEVGAVEAGDSVTTPTGPSSPDAASMSEKRETTDPSGEPPTSTTQTRFGVDASHSPAGDAKIISDSEAQRSDEDVDAAVAYWNSLLSQPNIELPENVSDADWTAIRKAIGHPFQTPNDVAGPGARSAKAAPKVTEESHPRVTPSELRMRMMSELHRQDDIFKYAMELDNLEHAHTQQVASRLVEHYASMAKTQTSEMERQYESAMQQQAYEMSLAATVASTQMELQQRAMAREAEIQQTQAVFREEQLHMQASAIQNEANRVAEALSQTAQMYEMERIIQQQRVEAYETKLRAESEKKTLSDQFAELRRSTAGPENDKAGPKDVTSAQNVARPVEEAQTTASEDAPDSDQYSDASFDQLSRSASQTLDRSQGLYDKSGGRLDASIGSIRSRITDKILESVLDDEPYIPYVEDVDDEAVEVSAQLSESRRSARYSTDKYDSEAFESAIEEEPAAARSEEDVVGSRGDRSTFEHSPVIPRRDNRRAGRAGPSKAFVTSSLDSHSIDKRDTMRRVQRNTSKAIKVGRHSVDAQKDTIAAKMLGEYRDEMESRIRSVDKSLKIRRDILKARRDSQLQHISSEAKKRSPSKSPSRSRQREAEMIRRQRVLDEYEEGKAELEKERWANNARSYRELRRFYKVKLDLDSYSSNIETKDPERHSGAEIRKDRKVTSAKHESTAKMPTEAVSGDVQKSRARTSTYESSFESIEVTSDSTLDKPTKGRAYTYSSEQFDEISEAFDEIQDTTDGLVDRSRAQTIESIEEETSAEFAVESSDPSTGVEEESKAEGVERDYTDTFDEDDDIEVIEDGDDDDGDVVEEKDDEDDEDDDDDYHDAIDDSNEISSSRDQSSDMPTESSEGKISQSAGARSDFAYSESFDSATISGSVRGSTYPSASHSAALSRTASGRLESVSSANSKDTLDDMERSNEIRRKRIEKLQKDLASMESERQRLEKLRLKAAEKKALQEEESYLQKQYHDESTAIRAEKDRIVGTSPLIRSGSSTPPSTASTGRLSASADNKAKVAEMVAVLKEPMSDEELVVRVEDDIAEDSFASEHELERSLSAYDPSISTSKIRSIELEAEMLRMKVRKQEAAVVLQAQFRGYATRRNYSAKVAELAAIEDTMKQTADTRSLIEEVKIAEAAEEEILEDSFGSSEGSDDDAVAARQAEMQQTIDTQEVLLDKMRETMTTRDTLQAAILTEEQKYDLDDFKPESPRDDETDDVPRDVADAVGEIVDEVIEEVGGSGSEGEEASSDLYGDMAQDALRDGQAQQTQPDELPGESASKVQRAHSIDDADAHESSGGMSNDFEIEEEVEEDVESYEETYDDSDADDDASKTVSASKESDDNDVDSTPIAEGEASRKPVDVAVDEPVEVGDDVEKDDVSEGDVEEILEESSSELDESSHAQEKETSPAEEVPTEAYAEAQTPTDAVESNDPNPEPHPKPDSELELVVDSEPALTVREMSEGGLSRKDSAASARSANSKAITLDLDNLDAVDLTSSAGFDPLEDSFEDETVDEADDPAVTTSADADEVVVSGFTRPSPLLNIPNIPNIPDMPDQMKQSRSEDADSHADTAVIDYDVPEAEDVLQPLGFSPTSRASAHPRKPAEGTTPPPLGRKPNDFYAEAGMQLQRVDSDLSDSVQLTPPGPFLSQSSGSFTPQRIDKASTEDSDAETVAWRKANEVSKPAQPQIIRKFSTMSEINPFTGERTDADDGNEVLLSEPKSRTSLGIANMSRQMSSDDMQPFSSRSAISMSSFGDEIESFSLGYKSTLSNTPATTPNMSKSHSPTYEKEDEMSAVSSAGIIDEMLDSAGVLEKEPSMQHTEVKREESVNTIGTEEASKATLTYSSTESSMSPRTDLVRTDPNSPRQHTPDPSSTASPRAMRSPRSPRPSYPELRAKLEKEKLRMKAKMALRELKEVGEGTAAGADADADADADAAIKASADGEELKDSALEMIPDKGTNAEVVVRSERADQLAKPVEMHIESKDETVVDKSTDAILNRLVAEEVTSMDSIIVSKLRSYSPEKKKPEGQSAGDPDSGDAYLSAAERIEDEIVDAQAELSLSASRERGETVSSIVDDFDSEEQEDDDKLYYDDNRDIGADVAKDEAIAKASAEEGAETPFDESEEKFPAHDGSEVDGQDVAHGRLYPEEKPMEKEGKAVEPTLAEEPPVEPTFETSSSLDDTIETTVNQDTATARSTQSSSPLSTLGDAPSLFKTGSMHREAVPKDEELDFEEELDSLYDFDAAPIARKPSTPSSASSSSDAKKDESEEPQADMESPPADPPQPVSTVTEFVGHMLDIIDLNSIASRLDDPLHSGPLLSPQDYDDTMGVEDSCIDDLTKAAIFERTSEILSEIHTNRHHPPPATVRSFAKRLAASELPLTPKYIQEAVIGRLKKDLSRSSEVMSGSKHILELVDATVVEDFQEDFLISLREASNEVADIILARCLVDMSDEFTSTFR